MYKNIIVVPLAQNLCKSNFLSRHIYSGTYGTQEICKSESVPHVKNISKGNHSDATQGL